VPGLHFSHSSDEKSLLVKAEKPSVSPVTIPGRGGSARRTGLPGGDLLLRDLPQSHSSSQPHLLRAAPTTRHGALLRLLPRAPASRSPSPPRRRGAPLLPVPRRGEAERGWKVIHSPSRTVPALLPQPALLENPRLLAGRDQLCVECHSRWEEDHGAACGGHRGKGCLSCHRPTRHRRKGAHGKGQRSLPGLPCKVRRPRMRRRSTTRSGTGVHGMPQSPWLRFPRRPEGPVDRVCYSCHTGAEANFLKANTTSRCSSATATSATTRTGAGEKAPQGTGATSAGRATGTDEADAGRASHEPFKGGECLTCHDATGPTRRG